MGFPPVEGTYLAEWLAAGLLILFAFAMALFDLPGNTVMVLSGLGFAFYDPAKYFDIRLISAMILVYAMGEIWEFALSFFGIKKKVKNFSWWAVLFIGCGTFVGTLLAFVAAYLYEYMQSRRVQSAGALAWQAAKMQFMAMLGKLVATFVLAILLAKQIFFYH